MAPTVPHATSVGVEEAEEGAGAAGAGVPHGHVHADGSHEEHLLPRLALIPHHHTKAGCWDWRGGVGGGCGCGQGGVGTVDISRR